MTLAGVSLPVRAWRSGPSPLPPTPLFNMLDIRQLVHGEKAGNAARALARRYVCAAPVGEVRCAAEGVFPAADVNRAPVLAVVLLSSEAAIAAMWELAGNADPAFLQRLVSAAGHGVALAPAAAPAVGGCAAETAAPPVGSSYAAQAEALYQGFNPALQEAMRHCIVRRGEFQSTAAAAGAAAATGAKPTAAAAGATVAKPSAAVAGMAAAEAGMDSARHVNICR